MKLNYLKATLKTCLNYYKKNKNQQKVEEISERIAKLNKK
jgi:hypothetical protein